MTQRLPRHTSCTKNPTEDVMTFKEWTAVIQVGTGVAVGIWLYRDAEGAMPATIEAMYEPEVMGRTASTTVTIAP